MNDREATRFIEEYFSSLFMERDVDVLDRYLHPDYWDDDCGQEGINHIEDSKEYLRDLFSRIPTVGVSVGRVTAEGNVITAFLDWTLEDADVITTWKRGIAIFVLEGDRIRKRHTYIYDSREIGE